MTTEFMKSGLIPELEQTVTELGYLAPTPIQSETIPLMLEGLDVIGQAQTGTGKTAAFMLPIIQNLKKEQRGIQALVLVPTRELALQVAQASTEYGKHLKARVLTVYGGQPYYQQVRQLRQGVDIVVGTPGRILDLINQKELDLSTVSTAVIDEADEMLSMGFIQDIESILSFCPEERQTALFSATMPPRVTQLAKKYMKTPRHVAIESEHLTVDAVEHRYCLVNEAEKLAVLTRLFEVETISSALIFVNTRVGTSDLVNELMGRGFPAEALNGDLAQQTREQVLNRFRNRQISVLVATDMAARGLDITDISHVIIYDLPDDPELYVHRAGRTGRAGKSGTAISLVTRKQLWRLHRIEGYTRQPITRIPIPTVEQINHVRDEKMKEQLLLWLKRGRCQKELTMVEQLTEEGFDVSQIAAAAIKVARREEKQRPIAAASDVPEVREKRPVRMTNNPDGRQRNDRFNRTVERGMARFVLSAGKMHGIRPADIVGSIAQHGKIPGSVIGAITISERHSTVDIPERFAGQVLLNAGTYKLKNTVVTLKGE
jgi:ATP-dependent RNA helicase DeaD